MSHGIIKFWTKLRQETVRNTVGVKSEGLFSFIPKGTFSFQQFYSQQSPGWDLQCGDMGPKQFGDIICDVDENSPQQVSHHRVHAVESGSSKQCQVNARQGIQGKAR